MIRAFVSSTFRDLKDHRAYVIERLERSGIFVDPMEKWSAAGDEPKDLSTERVKECELFILLVGFRRGHVPEGDIRDAIKGEQRRSITQLEYDEARRLGLKPLVFVADEEANWPPAEIAALKDDPETARWRSELLEHKTVGKFTPHPESIDVDAAVSRWLQERASGAQMEDPGTADEGTAAIDIRVYSNSDGALIVWRSRQRIDGCLGYALHRRVLGTAGITDEMVSTFLGSPGEQTKELATPAPSHRRPIQRFRWFDREQREVRYRVVPVMGTPGDVFEADGPHRGSAWTRWVTPRTGQNPECRAFFNHVHSTQASARAFGREGTGDEDTLAKKLRQGRSDLRSYLGGGLRRAILGLLDAARMTDQRIYAALSDLDDPDVVARVANLGKNVHLLLGPRSARQAGKGHSRSDSRAKLCRQLRDKCVQVYERRQAGAGLIRSNFAVLCDRWGSPMRVLSGSAAWTIRALCLRRNNGILLDSVPLARAYLDRWEYLLGTRNTKVRQGHGGKAGPAHVREHGMSITGWNSPIPDKADLRDVKRLIRGARQGVLFLANARHFEETLMPEILLLVRDKDLFIEGLTWSPGRGRSRIQYTYYVGEKQDFTLQSSSEHPIDSTIVLVDPFGPHPVVMTGSHDLSSESSAKKESDLLIIENVPGLAAEYAVHLLGLFDHYKFRHVLVVVQKMARLSLAPDDAWQDRYFKGDKRREFNFLFGSLSPGLDL